jgi:hypothetical protein
MSTHVLKLIETDSKLLEAAAMHVYFDGEGWYNLPHWYKKIGDGLFVEYSFDDLPSHFKKFIEENISQKENKAI